MTQGLIVFFQRLLRLSQCLVDHADVGEVESLRVAVPYRPIERQGFIELLERSSACLPGTNSYSRCC